MSEETTKKRGGNHGSPTIGNNGLAVQPGDLTSYITSMVELKRLPMPQTDAEVEQRIDLYFQWCIEKDLRPGIEGLAFSLGVSRKTLWEWESGNSWGNTKRAELIKYAKQGICMLTEQMGLKGKLNPLTYIFTMKNHFNYSDRNEFEIIPHNQFNDAVPMDDIKKLVEQDGTQSFDSTEETE